MSRYIAKLVRMDGTVVTTFDAKLEPQTITWGLNEPDQFDLHFPKNLLAQSDLDVLATGGTAAELVIEDTANSNKVLSWGVIVSTRGAGSQADVVVHCEGVEWYLLRRFLDGPQPNFIPTNPDFESTSPAFDGWVDNAGASITPGAEITDDGGAGLYNVAQSADVVQVGSLSAALTGDAGTANVTAHYIEQNIGTLNGGTIGLALILSGWFWVDTSVENPIQAAEDGKGLYLRFQDPVTHALITDNWFVVEAATAPNKWTKAEVALSIPPSTTYEVIIRAYAPALGRVFWDDLKLVDFASYTTGAVTGNILTAANVSDWLPYLIAQLQVSAAPFGKSDVNIASDTSALPGSLVLAKIYNFSEHVQFDQALQEFVDQDDVLDYAMVYDLGAGTRTMTFYAPKRGTDLTGSVTLTFNANGVRSSSNCADYRVTRDGANCITTQFVLGDDFGPDREEGYASDASAVDGIILEDVRQSPQGTLVRYLQPHADARLKLFKAPPFALEMDIRPDAGINPLDLNPGDLVAVAISDGYFSIAQNLRITQIKLNCATNVLTVSLAVDTLT